MVAVLLLIAGSVYLAVQCQHIPAPLPGREAGDTRHRIGFAAIAFALAAVWGVIAVIAGRLRPASD